MRPVHIIGRRNQGKTTLMIGLLGELTRRGLRVGSIKHSSHPHVLDQPGKDSYRHREAGADPAAFVTSSGMAVYLPRPVDGLYDRLLPLFAGCDVVLVEGYTEEIGTKLEVWRQDTGTTPLTLERDDVTALVTDAAIDVPVPVWPLGDIPALADHVEALAGVSTAKPASISRAV